MLEVEAQVDTVDRTGVEMEALTACSVAALTIYDMCKSADRTMTVGDLALWEKSGGRSGPWRRPGVEPPLTSSIPPRPARSTRRSPSRSSPATPAPPPGLHSVPVTQVEEAPVVGKGIVGAITVRSRTDRWAQCGHCDIARHHGRGGHHARRRHPAGRSGRPGPRARHPIRLLRGGEWGRRARWRGRTTRMGPRCRSPLVSAAGGQVPVIAAATGPVVSALLCSLVSPTWSS